MTDKEKKDYIPRYYPGDTRLEQIEYDKDIIVIVRGRQYRRHFLKLICEHPDCDEVIPVHFYPEKGGSWRIIGQAAHNKRRFHSIACANLGRSTKQCQLNKHGNVKHPDGYIKPFVTQEKFNSNWEYIRSL